MAKKTKQEYWLVRCECNEVLHFTSEKDLVDWLSSADVDNIGEAECAGLYLFTSPPSIPYVERTYTFKQDKNVAYG